jgi:hypothetical protein
MKNYYLSFIFLIMLFALSCSSQNSVAPVLDNTQNGSGNTSLPVFVSDRDSASNPLEGQGFLGLFSGTASLDNLSIELSPLRKSSLTDTLEVVDITNFLALAPCSDCVKIKSVSLNGDGNLVATIGIRHPFPAGDPLKPITGRNRGDLHVFNVEGIVAAQSGSTYQFPVLGVSIADSGLANPDGYTTYLDPYLDEIYPTDADSHPYVMHFDDYTEGNFSPDNPMGFDSVTTPPPSGNLVMPMGSDYDDQDYIFDFSGSPEFNFIFAVGCTYAVSAATKIQRFSPEYRVPQHNKKAASEVWVDVTSNDLVAGDTLSSADLSIHVLDISHGVPAGDNLNEMKYESNVAGIMIELPGIISGLHTDYVEAGGDGRDPLNSLTFTTTITNSAGGGDGTYRGLVKVLDSYPTGQNESPLLDGKDGIQRVDPLINPLTAMFDINEFATYASFTIEVSTVPQDPIAVIMTDPDPPNVGTSHPVVTFDGSNSYDPDGGSITLFEWDFDWDGVPANFVPDLSDTNPVAVRYYSCEEVTFTAGLRVTDDDTPAGISAIESVEVIISDDFISGSWEGSTQLGFKEALLGDYIVSTGQMLNTDSAGLSHVITYDFNYSTVSNIYHRTFDGTTLSAKETFYLPYYITGVTSALDADGHVHIVWFRGGSPRTVEHVEYSNSSFGSVSTLHTTQTGYQSNWINIQNNPDGDVMVMWINSRSDWLDSKFMYTINDGSGFTIPDFASDLINIRLNSTGSSNHHVSPVLISTPDNGFRMIYYMLDADLSYNRVIYEIKYDGSSWSPMSVVYDNPYSSYVPYDLASASGPDGDVHLVGAQLGGTYIEYYRWDVSTGLWSTPVRVGIAGNGNFAFPAVDTDEAGNVHVLWAKEADKRIYSKVFCESMSESEILAIPDVMVDSTTVNQNQRHPDVCWDGYGNLMAIYQDEWFDNYYSYFNRLVYD